MKIHTSIRDLNVPVLVDGLVERAVRSTLAPFADDVTAVHVRLDRGAQGSVQCHVLVGIRSGGGVGVATIAYDLRALIALAAERAAEAVGHALEQAARGDEAAPGYVLLGPDWNGTRRGLKRARRLAAEDAGPLA